MKKSRLLAIHNERLLEEEKFKEFSPGYWDEVYPHIQVEDDLVVEKKPKKKVKDKAKKKPSTGVRKKKASKGKPAPKKAKKRAKRK